MKNIRYGLSLNKTNASVPSAFDAEPAGADFAFGGVLGKIKLNNPNPADAIAAIINVELVFSIPSLEISTTDTIQPMVPNTRIHGNCFPGSFICENATLLDSAIVGMYKRE